MKRRDLWTKWNGSTKDLFCCILFYVLVIFTILLIEEYSYSQAKKHNPYGFAVKKLDVELVNLGEMQGGRNLKDQKQPSRTLPEFFSVVEISLDWK